MRRAIRTLRFNDHGLRWSVSKFTSTAALGTGGNYDCRVISVSLLLCDIKRQMVFAIWRKVVINHRFLFIGGPIFLAVNVGSFKVPEPAPIIRYLKAGWINSARLEYNREYFRRSGIIGRLAVTTIKALQRALFG